MIANLIATIMMALGVVSGTQATSNTFYDANHTKPIQRQNVTENKTIGYDEVAVNTDFNGYKYYLKNGNVVSPNYTAENYNIYNTTYTYYKNSGSSNKTIYLVSIYELTTYYNYTYQDFTMTQNVIFSADLLNPQTSSLVLYYESFITNPTDITAYIDLSLTQSNINEITNMINNNNIKSNRVASTQNLGYQTAYVDQNNHNQYIIQNIQPNQKYQIVMTTLLDINGTTATTSIGSITPEALNVTGEAIIPESNYEVVDIPNVMYTILTMPFSFISTAFNLTVFPNTPYALNFGNLFLTIVAIFILLWLIKKVFH